MLKKYVAICYMNGKRSIENYDYNNKKEFAKDLHSNGFRIKYGYIFTEKEYQAFEKNENWIYNKINNMLNKRTYNSNLYKKIKKEKNKLKKELNNFYKEL